MPTEGTDFHGRYGFKAFSSHAPLSEIGNASNTFMFCVFRAFRGPLFRNLGLRLNLQSFVLGELGLVAVKTQETISFQQHGCGHMKHIKARQADSIWAFALIR